MKEKGIFKHLFQELLDIYAMVLFMDLSNYADCFVLVEISILSVDD